MPFRRSAWVLSAIVLSGGLVPLHAQLTARVGPGSVVRWRDPSDASVQGTVVAITSDSLRAIVGTTPLLIALAAHPELQVRGDRGGSGRGALIGLGVGAAFGAALGVIAGRDCTSGTRFCFSRGQLAKGLGASFAFSGLVVGSLVKPAYQWQPLRPDQVVSPVQIRRLVTWSNGPALGVNVRF